MEVASGALVKSHLKSFILLVHRGLATSFTFERPWVRIPLSALAKRR